MILEKNENTVFKNYRAVKPLGRGSYGCVYEMYDLENNESFALKEVPISSENVPSFMAEILPDCVVCHENIQKYHPFVISRRPTILKNLSSNRSSPMKSTPVIQNNQTSNKEEQNYLLNLNVFGSSNMLPSLKTEEKGQPKGGDRILFEEVFASDDQEIVEEARSHKKLSRTHSWSLGKKFKKNTAKSKRFYMYLKTKVCDFSLRDFIDFRNHLLFRMIDGDTNLSVDCKLDNQVHIPMDLYKKSVKEDKKINKKFSFGIFRCILLGLIHLHSFGIAHNDIKSSNILLDSKDFFRPKIADFGMKTYCERSHDKKDSESPYNFYDYCSSISKCDHLDRNKVEDCRALIYILYELLHPCKTQSEMLYLLRDLKKMKKVPKDFKALYHEESRLIEKVLTDNKITATSLLTMFDNLNQ